MQFENRFDVDAPLDEVWATVLDVERVAPTVPGAKVLEKTSDTSYKVAIKVKVGPMSMTYKADVEIVERDDTAHRAVMRARAKESRGQGTADANVTMVLSGDDGRTAAHITTDVDVSGKAASMGQGVLQDVSGRLVQTFAKNLATMLEGGAPPEPPQPPPAPDQRTKPPKLAAAPDGPAPPPPPKPRAAAGAAGGAGSSPPQYEDALDLGSVGGAMVADKLSDPRNLGLVIGFVAFLAYLLGRRSAR